MNAAFTDAGPDKAPLPEVLPIFPLAGVLLLPGGRLPLHIFEPRYLAMADDALARDRLIGIIQPKAPDEASPAGSVGDAAAVYETGCAGRIIEFTETPDRRLLLTLGGVSRFRVARELDLEKGYRRVEPDWTPFAGDVAGAGGALAGRDALLAALRRFSGVHGVAVDWKEIQDWPATTLVASVAMMCPFEAGEKQALLECADWEARAGMLVSLMEMAMHTADAGAGPSRH